MTPTEYRAAIKSLGLVQERAGPVLGVSPRMSQSYATGEHPVPEPVAKLLRLALKLGLKSEDIP